MYEESRYNEEYEYDSDEEEDEDDLSDVSTSEEEEDLDDMAWIEWFCSRKQNVYFVEIDEDYISDDFNLAGLSTQVNDYGYALSLILDTDDPNYDISVLSSDRQEACEGAAELLYGLVHARFILTTRGQQLMANKFDSGIFGICPNVNCEKQYTLPIGLSDSVNQSGTHIYCPRCCEIYETGSRLSNIDGAFFGTSFAPLFCLSRPSVPRVFYQPRIFGFKVSNTVRDMLRLKYYNTEQHRKKLQEENGGVVGTVASGAAASSAPSVVSPSNPSLAYSNIVP